MAHAPYLKVQANEFSFFPHRQSFSFSFSFFSFLLSSRFRFHSSFCLPPNPSTRRLRTSPSDAHARTHSLEHIFPDAVLAAHRRPRSRPGAMGRRAGCEEYGPDGCAGGIHGERASPSEHPCSRGTPRCPLRGFSASYHRTWSSSSSPFHPVPY